MVEQGQAARDRVAQGIGAAVEPEAAGEAASQGAQAFITRTGQRGRTLYDRTERLAGDARVEPVSARIQSQGRGDAARAYAVADRYWRNRLSSIDDVLAPIVVKNGEKSGEQVVQSLQTAAKGSSARLSAFVRALPPEESATVRST